MRLCPTCKYKIKFKVVQKEVFIVNVMPQKDYCAYIDGHPERILPSGIVGAFCPNCGNELIELLSQKKNLHHIQGNKTMIE